MNDTTFASWRLCINLPFVFSDTICDLGGVDELANYGEYSGAPSEQQTYDYAKTILSLMTREKHPQGECSLWAKEGVKTQNYKLLTSVTRLCYSVVPFLV